MTHQHDHTTILGTVTGTTFTVIANIDSQAFIETVILAIVGATVSFFASLVLKWIRDQFK